MVLASQVREGMCIRLAAQVYKVLECEVKAGGGQQGGVVKLKLRAIDSGRLWDHHFRPDERLDNLGLDRQTMDFLYADADSCTFMNPDTFEQVEVPRALLGRAEKFLREGMSLPVEFFEGRPVNVMLPDIVEARIAETAPPSHSGQDSTWKHAVLDNGLSVQVPLFVASGELIRVDTRTGRYVERVRLERKKGA